MIQLSVSDVRKFFGPEPVLDGLSFDLRPGERVGLVGPNGVGKTTLLRIITGSLEPDSGSATWHRSVSWGILEQRPDFDPQLTVWEIARSGLAELIAMAAEAESLAKNLGDAAPQEQQRLGARLDQLHHQLQQRDGYHLDHKITRVLNGLRLDESSYHQPATQLSGGQQNRLLLAKLLLAAPDVMLLDEPSNHLDLEATRWLEEYLAALSSSLLVVSHDRYLLDKVTNRTLELFQGTVEEYSGNYSAYRRQKVERLEVQRRTYEKQQEFIAKTEDFIRRNHYGQKHIQAEDRRKKLERLERVPPPREIAGPSMAFPAASRTGDLVLRAEGVSKAYDRTLFQDLSFVIERGERWGILGPNASGKTTLLRCVMNPELLDAGRFNLGTGVKIGYLDQQLGGLPPEISLLEAVRPSGEDFTEQRRRDLLARFGLTGDIVFQKIGELSGGERSRAGLTRLAAEQANVLFLDEPTNHLDLWARDALEDALRRFDGTVILVSHDRYFLNNVVDHLLVYDDQRFRIIEGNYDTYLHFVSQGLAAGDEIPRNGKPVGGQTDSKEKSSRGKQTVPPKRKRKFPYRKLEDLEAEILEYETQIGDAHMLLTEQAVLRDGERVKALKAEIATAEKALETLYEHWDEAAELN
ncbi:MAG: ABC-F family ATP-binding cassette domain-containing protein [Pirellulales bacterium]|nr:ABC-F family ATP-binding cassette domain-containing protein [Pirellulales bacterium]